MSREVLRLFRGLYKEFLKIHKKDKVLDSPACIYIIDQFRKHQMTSEKHCRGKNEMQHVGETYLCYLQSIRKQEELAELYKGKGERSIESSANLVGLTLPNTSDGDLNDK